MATVPSVVIDQNGIQIPTYAEIYTYLKDQMRAIYGVDLYLEPDSQDGQFIGIVAESVNNAFQSAVAVYNGYSPQTAQGVGLSNAVLINGITRRVATHSTVTLDIQGDAFAVITNGVATDLNNVRWLLPASVTVPGGGSISVSATAEDPGAVQAPSGTITIIGTPTRGWNTVTNPLAAIPGDPVETDAELRVRQRSSTALPSQGLLDGLLGGLLATPDVIVARVYENDTNSTDGNGIPAHSIAAVVTGGADADIAETIYLKKTPGCYTYGTTVYSYVTPSGVAMTLRWFRPTLIPIKVEVTVQALTGYTSVIGDQIKAALVDYITNGTQVGDDIYWSRLFTPANLPSPNGDTYDITLMRLARVGNAFGTANLVMSFIEQATLTTGNTTIIVV